MNNLGTVLPYYESNDPIIKHHNSPYYFNGGEIFVLAMIGALTVALGLMFYQAVVVTYQSISDDSVPAAWVAFVVVFAIAIIVIILLNHCKKHLMRLAHKSKLLRASI
jgi:hypothetical protein